MAKTESATDWVIDSGASSHITMNEENLNIFCEPSTKEIVVGDNGRLNVKCAGDVQMELVANGKSDKEKVILKNVLCVPNISANIMSVSQFAKRGKTLVFDKQSCRIFDENSNLMATVSLVNNLCRLNCGSDRTASALAVTTDINLWHRRMAHTCENNLKKIKSSVTGVEFSGGVVDQCVVCSQGK